MARGSYSMDLNTYDVLKEVVRLIDDGSQSCSYNLRFSILSS